MLTFEYDPNDALLELHGDVEGLKKLKDKIDAVIKLTHDGEFDHIHMMIPDWGGEDLTGEKMNEDDSVSLIRHVKLFCWKKEIN